MLIGKTGTVHSHCTCYDGDFYQQHDQATWKNIGKKNRRREELMTTTDQKRQFIAYLRWIDMLTKFMAFVVYCWRLSLVYELNKNKADLIIHVRAAHTEYSFPAACVPTRTTNSMLLL
jgi:hypothetical protein